MEGIAVKCPFCGGAIDVSPDSVVTVCKFCGNVVSMTEFECEAKVLRHMNERELEEKIYSKIKSKIGDITPEKREIIYIPVYTSPVHVSGVALMAVQEGNKRDLKTVRVEKDMRVAVYGRYGSFEGLKYILEEVESGRIKLEKSNKMPERYRVLSAQKSVEEAKKEIREKSEDVARPGLHIEKLSGLVGEEAVQILEKAGFAGSIEGLKFWDADVDIKAVELLFFPVFMYSWKFRGSRYTTVADGTDGSIIVSKSPVLGWMRFAAVAFAAILAIASGYLVSKTLYAIPALSGLAFVSSSLATRGDVMWRRI